MKILAQEEFLKIMLKNLNNHEDKSPNAFAYDVLSATGIIFQRMNEIADELEKGFFVDNREGEDLDKFVFQISGITRNQATKATGTITVSGEDGLEISKGTVFLAGDVEFISLETQRIKGGSVDIKVQCTIPGSVGDVVPNTVNKLKEPLGTIHNITNKEEFFNGYDEESDEDLRERYKDKLLNPPKGGNPAHYKLWATEVDGIWNAKVFRTFEGAGTVKVVIVGNDRRKVSSEMIEKVKNHIISEAPLEWKNLTVESAKEKDINISVNVQYQNGYSEINIKEKLKKEIEKYLFNIAFKESDISIAKIGAIILSFNEVKDYKELKINNYSKNLELKEDEVPRLTKIELNNIE